MEKELTMREALSWALDLLDLYDMKLIAMGEPRNKVYSDIHLAGKERARAALAKKPERPAEPWLYAISETNHEGKESWHDGEQCVFGDRESAQDEVDSLNDEYPEGEFPFKVVPLYRALLTGVADCKCLSQGIENCPAHRNETFTSPAAGPAPALPVPQAEPVESEYVSRAAKLFERIQVGYTMDDARMVAWEFAAIRLEAERPLLAKLKDIEYKLALNLNADGREQLRREIRALADSPVSGEKE